MNISIDRSEYTGNLTCNKMDIQFCGEKDRSLKE